MHVSIEGFVMPAADSIETVAARLRLLGDPTRLRIVCALVQGESDVSCLSGLAGVGLPAVSQHLSKLRLAGVVRCHREGQRMVYELTDATVRDLVADLLDHGEATVKGRRGQS
jgi:DNA-binding transcriptional ArsR family regulator